MKAHHAQKPAIPLDNLSLEQLPTEKKEKFLLVLLDLEFLNAKTFRQQVSIACSILRDDDGSKMSFEDIGSFFGVSAACVHKQLKKSKRNIQNVGRPSVLPPEAIDFIQNLIDERFQNKRPITYDMLIDEIQYNFHIEVKLDTMRHICRALPNVKTVRGIPMEKSRVEASPEDIKKYYKELDQAIHDVPGAFIFNIDEAGCSDWTDAHEITVLVPNQYEKSTIEIPVDRNSKRATIVACIAADGSFLKPMIILPRKTMELDLLMWGYTNEKALFAYQKNAFMTTVLFEEWAKNVFFEELKKRRQLYDYNGQAVIIMDGLSAHYSHAFLEECKNQNVKVMFLVPHSSDQCQPLDLVIFSLLKRFYSRSTFDKTFSKQTQQVIKMLGAWYQSTAPHLIQSAFRAAGLENILIDNTIYWYVSLKNATKLRNVDQIIENFWGRGTPHQSNQEARIRIGIGQ